MNRNLILMCLGFVVIAVICLTAFGNNSSVAAETPAQAQAPAPAQAPTPTQAPAPAQAPKKTDEVLNELKKLRAKVKTLSDQLAVIQEIQMALVKLNTSLVASTWEYKVESIHGGASRDRLEALLKKMGNDKFEYVALTDDGLYLFRRRIIETDE